MNYSAVGEPSVVTCSLDDIRSPAESSRHVRAPSASHAPRPNRAWLASLLIHAAGIVICAAALPDFARWHPPVVDTTPCMELAWCPTVTLVPPEPLSPEEAQQLLFTTPPEAVLPEHRDEAERLVPLTELADAEPEDRPTAESEAAAEENAAPDALADASAPAGGTLEGWLLAQVKPGAPGGGGGGGNGDGLGGIGVGGGNGSGYSGAGGRGGGTGTGGAPGVGTATLGRGSGRGGASRHARPAARLQPAYPERQRLAGRAATVLLLVSVGASGQAERVEVLTSDVPEDFIRSASSAARAMRYEPALEDGQPVASTIRVRVEYKLE